MSEPARDTPRCRAIDEEHDAKRRALPPFPGCLQVTAIENARNLAYVALARTLERDLAEAHAAAADLSADVTKIAQERDEALSRLSDGNGLLNGAEHALRSYQFGNAAPELAESMADNIRKYLNKVEAPK